MGLDWRLLTIGGIVVLGVAVLVLIFVFGGSGSSSDGGAIGVRQPDDGRNHIPEGTSGGPYHSIPATSGNHWSVAPSATDIGSPGPWGVYATAQPQERMLHNLEHGGIVIWYQPSRLDKAGVDTLTAWVQQQITTSQFKVILTPWSGPDFGHPVAVTAWFWLLYLDTPNTDSINAFLSAHYDQSPEPFGGPAQPGT